MSLGRLSAFLLLVSTLIACPGGSPKPPETESPVLPSTSLGESTVGAPFARSLAASGGAAPLSYSAQGLPAGIALDTNTGALSGSPSSAGHFDIEASVTDAENRSHQRSYALVVLEAPRFITSSLPPASLAASYAARVEATGGKAPLAFRLGAGSLPSGFVIDASGTISGTPATLGTSSFEISVTDAHGAVTRAQFTLEVRPVLTALVLTTAALPEAWRGSPFLAGLEASGGLPPYSYSLVAGSLPADVQFDNTGRFSGTPTATGTFDITLKVQDAAQQSITRAFLLTVREPPAITSSTLPEGATGQPYTAQLSATGGQGTLSWSHSGTLPPGLSLASHGAISGTPTLAGTFTFTATVTDAGSRTDSRSLTLVIQGPPSITTSELADGYLSSPYSTTLTASGGRAPLSWSSTSSLPSGLSLSSSGILSGTPSSTGSFTFTARVSDNLGRSASRSLTLTVYSLPFLNPIKLSDAYLSEPYSDAVSALDGKPPYTFSVVSGSLPAGLSLAPDGSVAGTPTTPGNPSFEVMVSDANGRTSRRPASMSVYSLPTLTTSSLPEARQGVAYSQSLVVSGGRPSYAFVLESGSTPPGITLDSEGSLHGTPTGGSSSFTVRVFDFNSRSDERTFTLSVYAPPRITTPALPNATLNTPYSLTLGSSGGRGTLFWSSSGTLPPGLSFSSDGSIHGTPTTAGTFTFTVTLQDSLGETDSRVFSLTVQAPLPDGGFPPDGGSDFTVGHWNIEWFGSNSLGPPRSTSPGGTLDDLQIANARDILSDAGVHLWGLVEIADSSDFQILKAQLPGYDGFLSNDPRVVLGSSYYSTDEQKLGVLFDSTLSVSDARLILTEWDSDFAGRPPLRVDFVTSIHGEDSPLTVILVHMKAFDDRGSYDKRQRAGIALKNYLDSDLPSSRVLVVGDWNDDVDVSITYESGVPLPSPYENFLNDSSNYTFVTRPLSLAGESSTVGYPDMIDHTLVSNELHADHVPDSAHVLRPGWITDYAGTTSDHYPVLSRYDFNASPGPLTLTLTGPAGGTYAGGSTLVITWNASPAIGAVALEFSLDAGASWSWLASVPDATVGHSTWTVPNVDSTGVLLRITDADTPWRQHTSDTPLTFVHVPPPHRVFINEYLANEPSGPLPDGGIGALTDHEFVEIVNAGPQAADLSQWTLWDGNTSAGPRHEFAPGTVLQPGKAWVIYGGPTAFPPGTPNTEAASSGRLGLNNLGTDQVTLMDIGGGIVSEHVYSSTLDAISANRAVDADPDALFVPHTDISPQPSSPGRRVDGSPF